MIVAGIDLGGTKCAAVLAEVQSERIKFLCRREVPTRGTWQSVMELLILYLKAQNLAIERCGISCGGPLNVLTGMILNPPNLTPFEGVPIVEYMQRALGCPAILRNDADACALAEWRFGAGRGTNSMIFLTFGTGLGAGLILDGRLYTGTLGLAGEVGHIRLEHEGPEGYRKRGSFEGFCSGGGIANLIALRTGEYYDAKELARRADEGDPKALALWEEIGMQFGQGLAILVDLLNPEVIIAGSIYTRAERHLREHALRALRAEALPESLEGFRLLPTQLGDLIGDYAAVAAAAEN